jgi:hypothetical protein
MLFTKNIYTLMKGYTFFINLSTLASFVTSITAKCVSPLRRAGSILTPRADYNYNAILLCKFFTNSQPNFRPGNKYDLAF